MYSVLFKTQQKCHAHLADSRKYVPEKIQERNSRFSYAPERDIFFAKFCFPFSAMPPKDLASFSYIYTPVAYYPSKDVATYLSRSRPHKNPLFMIKYVLSTSCRWCF